MTSEVTAGREGSIKHFLGLCSQQSVVHPANLKPPNIFSGSLPGAGVLWTAGTLNVRDLPRCWPPNPGIRASSLPNFPTFVSKRLHVQICCP